jgi:hypothetical protein
VIEPIFFAALRKQGLFFIGKYFYRRIRANGRHRQNGHAGLETVGETPTAPETPQAENIFPQEPPARILRRTMLLFPQLS